MSKVFLALGSNKGDRENYLRSAIHEFDKDESFRVIKTSSVYETLPYGKIPQNNYLNAMILVETSLIPNEIYFRIKDFEKKIGRTDSVRWGEREIDIDIILIDSLKISNSYITIPHKEFDKRDFVLAPLCEIEPNIINPNNGEKLIDKLNLLNERYIIRKVEFTLDYLGELN